MSAPDPIEFFTACAAFNAKLLAAAQAFLASHLMVRMDVRELRAAWQDPCTGAIPYDDLMNVPTFGYYLDLTPIEVEAQIRYRSTLGAITQVLLVR